MSAHAEPTMKTGKLFKVHFDCGGLEEALRQIAWNHKGSLRNAAKIAREALAAQPSRKP